MSSDHHNTVLGTAGSHAESESEPRHCTGDVSNEYPPHDEPPRQHVGPRQEGVHTVPVGVPTDQQGWMLALPPDLGDLRWLRPSSTQSNQGRPPPHPARPGPEPFSPVRPRRSVVARIARARGRNVLTVRNDHSTPPRQPAGTPTQPAEAAVTGTARPGKPSQPKY